ncbi:hypothetical protein [Burkholderia sp. Ac-20379]|uniref:hypothetical protein n=1 Tax=Burkholderia sp. Ac-20379 TaxID=2703900 RepID=UPI00197CD33A|nr:hypothetical protein [Burkholderia sp. Ac-20379]MBN3727954.1 hypothetical protein [Burkholderia sp. Ac-20379]
MLDVCVVRVEPFYIGADDASICLRCGETEIVAFHNGISSVVRVGDVLRSPLDAGPGFTLEAASLPDWPAELKQSLALEKLEKTPRPYGYKGVGRVMDRDRGIVSVLGFQIDFGDVLGIPNGDAVNFECERLDVC